MTSPSAAAAELATEQMSVPEKRKQAPIDKSDTLTVSSTGSSASAAFARSLFLFIGLMFRRPSKLFRPSRVDTWGGLRQLALQADQTLSPSFIRTLLKTRRGTIAILLTILPPLLVNTALGFLLFTSHSLFALSLARLPFFKHDHGSRLEDDTDHIDLQTLISGPTIVPRHPTLLAACAGAGAGIVQGMAFTPVENVVRLLQQSATSLSSLLIRILRLPLSKLPLTEPVPASPVEAFKLFFSSESWRKSSSWWAGWRWTVARDAYSVFFAAFDMTRRAGLRVKAFFAGPNQEDYNNIVSYSSAGKSDDFSTTGRVAQATTIVAGGVAASLAAEVAGRPFRACQRIIQTNPAGLTRPILATYRTHGLRPFLASGVQTNADPSKSRAQRVLRRVAWRLAGVGPWGFGFLVWAWVGGEI